MKTLVTAALLAAFTTSAFGATVCKSERDTQEHWRWRLIEGRKCWYPGRDRRDKALLTWERIIERKFYTREELAPVEFHPDEVVDTFDERWRLR